MGEILLIISATCRTVGCDQNGVSHVFEQETNIDFSVHCGRCQNQIEDIQTEEKP
jgi:hypothetical protein